MRIAVIPPLTLLDTFGTMGDKYHLCLSNEVLSYGDYAHFYCERGKKGDFVILDNSAHEQLQGQTLDQLERAIRAIEPTEVVLPDRLFFGDDTLQRAEEASPRLRRTFPHLRQMGVPQGRIFWEWDACLSGLKELGVDTIGISKDYEVWDGGLARLVSAVQSRGFQRDQIHLLGWGRELWQLNQLHDQVRGVDSAKPIVYALAGIRLPDVITRETTPPYPRRSSDYFERSLIETGQWDSFVSRTLHNIDVFRLHARGYKPNS